jgi:hypothetical protein
MDFIEQLFGLSPDNGDGSTEILWLAVLALLLAAFLYWKRHRFVRLSWGGATSRRRSGPQRRFTSISRTRAGEQDAVLVVGDIEIMDAKGMVGTVVAIDGADHVVHDIAARDHPIRPGQPIMLRVRKL